MNIIKQGNHHICDNYSIFSIIRQHYKSQEGQKVYVTVPGPMIHVIVSVCLLYCTDSTDYTIERR